MTKNLDLDGLRAIVHNYDLFYIDLWGVVHNGIKLYEGAISTLDELKKNKTFNKIKSLLISNNFLRVKIAPSWSFTPLCITPHRSI